MTELESLMEDLFDELFNDYAERTEYWMDFEEYRTSARGRMRKIVTKHSRRIANIAVNMHYERLSSKGKKGEECR